METNTEKDDLPIKGEVLSAVEKNGDEEIVFETTGGKRWHMNHLQDCCESVYIEDVIGDLGDLVGKPLAMAEVVSYSDEDPAGLNEGSGADPSFESFTWTFYKFATLDGYVTIRWLGASNGYYSESVDFYEEGARRW